VDHDALMQIAIAEAELARGSTGDNPWVGCAIALASGEVIARGHTQGPGEDHAEIAALRSARARGLSVEGATMYSTLEPCSFHARTPACARVLVEQKLARVVIGMNDPHPRVDGVGKQILRDAGIEVIEGICEAQIRRQLGIWVLTYHPHDVVRRARSLDRAALAETYAVDRELIDRALDGSGQDHE
jgi:diaminohydroxyphosphoribosylaminopyrimidine deaminase/5-amino-6-(5-phosphoribosylamino)uracil reductase